MNFKNKSCLFLIMLSLSGGVIQARPPKKSHSKKKEALISFSFENEPLVNIINYVADKKGVNVILPQQANKIESTVTWYLERKVTVAEAWNFLYTLLDLAGYSLLPEANFYRVVLKSKDSVSHIPTATYVGVPPEDLPDRDEVIHYLYYLSNIKVNGPESELAGILTTLLPDTASFKTDPATNALILMAKASDIKWVLDIVKRLDAVTDAETMEIIRLRFADAKVVANLFNENILKASEVNRYRLDTQKPTETSYFSQHMKVFAYDRLNALIVVGKISAVSRMKDFVLKYIDVEQGSGKSILHVYQLQYLDATKFAEVLRKIVTSTRPGGAEQAQAAPGASTIAGTERYFDEVRITVDRPPEIAEPAPGAEAQTPYYGGNKLIIAARNDDWRRIKKIIEELDTPSPQVYIEVLIADLTVNDQKLLGGIVRNPAKLPMPNDVNYQSSQFTPGIIPNSFSNPQTIGVIESPTKIAADLLRLGFTTGGVRDDAGGTSAASFAPPGSTLFSLNDNDGATWGLLKILKIFDHTKILSHPHIIALNNQQASIEVSDQRLIIGSASGNLGNTIVKNDWVTARLQVKLTPRISPGNVVNLYVQIDIDEFLPGSSNARITRKINTEANVNDGDILALGGLIKLNNTRGLRKTPVLADIPLFGWFFKNRESTDEKTNLTVFISPTIIQPRLREGASDLTRSYMDLAREYSQQESLFDSLRDPITRWYFKPDRNVNLMVESFLEKDQQQKIRFSNQIPDADDQSQSESDRRRTLIKTPSCSITTENTDTREREQELKQIMGSPDDEGNPFKNLPPPA